MLKLRKKIEEELANKTPLSIKDLSIKGNDIMSLGIPEGPVIGRILKDLLEVVLDDPSRNTRDALLEIAKGKLGKTD